MNKDQNNQSKNEPGQGSSENQLINYAGGYVTLPFNQDQFRDFVISLLGRPQTIEKSRVSASQTLLTRRFEVLPGA